MMFWLDSGVVAAATVDTIVAAGCGCIGRLPLHQIPVRARLQTRSPGADLL